MPESKRRQPQHRRRWTRYAQEGMLVQIDGSRHARLGERGPWLSLLAAIDDATSKLIAGVFREQEDTHGYFLLVQQMLQRHGRPWHSTMIVTAFSSRLAKPAKRIR